jgi:excisionase family DNA binding protein
VSPAERPDDVLTVEQAAAAINMSTRYVRRLVAERRIPFHKLGRSVRLVRRDLVAHLDTGRVEPLTASEVFGDLRSVA